MFKGVARTAVVALAAVGLVPAEASRAAE